VGFLLVRKMRVTRKSCRSKIPNVARSLPFCTQTQKEERARNQPALPLQSGNLTLERICANGTRRARRTDVEDTRLVGAQGWPVCPAATAVAREAWVTAGVPVPAVAEDL
jgi:hypothetical protein